MCVVCIGMRVKCLSPRYTSPSSAFFSREAPLIRRLEDGPMMLDAHEGQYTTCVGVVRMGIDPSEGFFLADRSE
jgi:hypothetical protein